MGIEMVTCLHGKPVWQDDHVGAQLEDKDRKLSPYNRKYPVNIHERISRYFKTTGTFKIVLAC